MSNLTLVRHAQASFFAEDYDQLSPHGERQAAALAKRCLATQQDIDAIYIGPRVRHRRTAEIIAEHYAAAGRDFPAPICLEGLDEHHVDQLLRDHMDALADQHPELPSLANAYHDATLPDDKQSSFQRLFESLVRLWAAGKAGQLVESWTDFQKRVNEAIDQIVANTTRSGQQVLAFTSVGPITVSLQRVLGCGDDVALSMGWRLWNCSLTNLVYSGKRITLDNFNSLPHLPDKADWTYR